MTEAPVKPTVDANMIALLRDRRFTMTGGSEFALEIVAALSRPPAAGQEPAWQPIETAPKDLTMLLWSEDGGTVVGHWLVGDTWGVCVPGTPMLFQPTLKPAPTYWMPLPAAPGAALPQGTAPAGGTQTQGESK